MGETQPSASLKLQVMAYASRLALGGIGKSSENFRTSSIKCVFCDRDHFDSCKMSERSAFFHLSALSLCVSSTTSLLNGNLPKCQLVSIDTTDLSGMDNKFA